MWKNATKIVLGIFIATGTLLTIALTLYAGLSTFLLGELYAILMNKPETEETAMVIAIIVGIIVFILGACYTFIGATNIGLKIEVAEDIEQIKINTTPQIKQPVPEVERLDINKFINPYQ